ncbi:MAG: magnesium transporter, partial [Desulfurococcales archaeon]|nr:magnesium transporter [Desulfurococcales archaeon]
LLHLGLYSKFSKAELASLILILVTVNSWVGFLTGAAALGLVGDVRIFNLIFIALASALLSSLFMIPSTTWLATISFRKGFDPDNLVAPIATLFGDMVTVPTIIASYRLSLHIPTPFMELAVSASAVTALASAGWIILKSRRGDPAWRRAVKVVKENTPIILASTSLSTAAGMVLLVNIDNIIESVGILAVVPAFLEDGGAIACRFSSRLSTSLHLGLLPPHPVPKSPWVGKQVIINFIHGLMIFTSLGVFGYAVAVWRGGAGLGVWIFLAVEVAGLILTGLISLITYYMAIAAFKAGIDPDNVLAPLLTSLADIIGTSSLAAMIAVFIHP